MYVWNRYPSQELLVVLWSRSQKRRGSIFFNPTKDNVLLSMNIHVYPGMSQNKISVYFHSEKGLINENINKNEKASLRLSPPQRFQRMLYKSAMQSECVAGNPVPALTVLSRSSPPSKKPLGPLQRSESLRDLNYILFLKRELKTSQRWDWPGNE